MAGFVEKIMDGLKSIVNGTVDVLAEKVIPQGAAELSQALNINADGYVPFGVPQNPLEVEGPATSYQDMLRESSQREVPDMERGMDR